ncbi:hypothetical protein ACTVCO_00040 [Sanguibacter sp. A247]|uniref:hypothetical protein n=1 Tax=unclassified Sanguibacter TaxID=2645534 RepID=UPI003FD87E13
MIEDIYTPLPAYPAPFGSEITWVGSRMSEVSGALTAAHATLRQVSGTSWRSDSATRFLSLLGDLSEALVTVEATCAEVETALMSLTQAMGAAESAAELARSVQP